MTTSRRENDLENDIEDLSGSYYVVSVKEFNHTFYKNQSLTPQKYDHMSKRISPSNPKRSPNQTVISVLRQHFNRLQSSPRKC